jgi:predicted AlkP superfamily phosphohydrolase/phosphomutase
MHTIILGFDAFDPTRFERLSEEGKLPNLTSYASSGNYARLAVANPPQTEVSWTSIATGLDPGGHGIFDFVHRDPATYTTYVSLLPTSRKLFGTQFVPPFNARTIFEEAARQGFPATALWWPASFPARPESLARTMPGLGTPHRGRHSLFHR